MARSELGHSRTCDTEDTFGGGENSLCAHRAPGLEGCRKIIGCFNVNDVQRHTQRRSGFFHSFNLKRRNGIDKVGEH